MDSGGLAGLEQVGFLGMIITGVASPILTWVLKWLDRELTFMTGLFQGLGGPLNTGMCLFIYAGYWWFNGRDREVFGDYMMVALAVANLGSSAIAVKRKFQRKGGRV